MKVGESKVISKFSDVRTIAKYRRCYSRNPSTYLCSASIVRGLSLIAMSQPRAPAVAGLGLLLANTTIEPLLLTPYHPWLYLPDERRHQVFDYIAAAAPLGEVYEDECRFYPLSIVLKRLRINFEPCGKMNVFVDMLVLIPFLDTFFLSDGPLKSFGKVTVYLHGRHLFFAPYPILRLLWASSRDPRDQWTFKPRKHFVRNSSCYRENHICLDTEPCPISDIQFCDLLQAIMKWEI
jgi:hypothetical protein